MRDISKITVFLVGSLIIGSVSCGNALSPGDCPGTPTDLKANVVAPYWGGLVDLEYQIPDGRPRTVDVEAYDPYLQIWSLNPYPATEISQRDDGTFVSLVSIPVTDTNKDLEQRVRVRALLEGCPATDWAESKSFKVSNPLSETTWVAQFTASDVIGTVSVQSSNVSPTGPYHVDPTTLSHTIHFSSNGQMQEEINLTLHSDKVGEIYDGCQLDVHLAGSYDIRLTGGAQVFVTGRHLTADPEMGSSCTNPSIASMAIRQKGALFPDVSFYLGNIDYTGLVASPKGQARWSDNLENSIGAIVNLMSVTTDTETTTVTSELDLSSTYYAKQ